MFTVGTRPQSFARKWEDLTMGEAVSVHHGDFGRAVLLQLDKPIITHAHREGHLIFKIGGGDAHVTVSGKSIAATEQTAVAVSPWEAHSFEACNPDNPFVCLVLYINAKWFLETGKPGACNLRFGRPQIARTAEVDCFALRLAGMLSDDQRSEALNLYLYETTSRCFHQSWQGQDNALMGRSNEFSDFRVRRSLDLMQESFAEDVEIDWLAREAGLSRPHFFKLFKKQTGITPNLYLNTLRSEHAIAELMKAEKSVTEISYDLGFSSQASFTRFFTSNVGIPPSDYRRVANVA